jgi:hypothetical protein
MTDIFGRPELSRRDLFRRGGLLGLVVAGGSTLVACGSGSGGAAGTGQPAGSPSAASIKAGGVLKAALTGEPDSLDPAVSSVYTGAQVYDNIFSKLLTMDPEGKFVGRLATKWTPTDPTTWTFDLVDNAYFHNGEKFTSADVKYTFERILNPKTASAYTALYTAIASITTPSPTQVVFKLKTPFGPFLTNLANNGEIVNQKAIRSRWTWPDRCRASRCWTSPAGRASRPGRWPGPARRRWSASTPARPCWTRPDTMRPPTPSASPTAWTTPRPWSPFRTRPSTS